MIALANERGCTADDLLQEQLDRLNEDSAFSESYIRVVNLHFVPLRAAAAIRNHRLMLQALAMKRFCSWTLAKPR